MMRFIFAALLVAAPPAALAQTYKCVDAKGATQYSDKPGRGCARLKGEPPPSAAPKQTEQRAFADRNQFAREQLARCGQARQSFKRGEKSDSVRETLRDCM